MKSAALGSSEVKTHAVLARKSAAGQWSFIHPSERHMLMRQPCPIKTITEEVLYCDVINPIFCVVMDICILHLAWNFFQKVLY